MDGFEFSFYIYFILYRRPPWDTRNVACSPLGATVHIVRDIQPSHRLYKCGFLKKFILRLLDSICLLPERNVILRYASACKGCSHSVILHGYTGDWPNVNDIVVGARVYCTSGEKKWHQTFGWLVTSSDNIVALKGDTSFIPTNWLTPYERIHSDIHY